MENRKTADIVLSICILSYNQPYEVRRFLKSILPQSTPEVEIVIKDDSSNSDTENVVKEYIRKGPIRYFRGKKGGLDKAIISITQEARGRYVWWFGDDVMADGAIIKVLSLIKSFPDISFIGVNSCDLNKCELAHKLGGDKFFKDRNQVIEEILSSLGFISATIFKRENALTGLKNSEKFIGSAFVNLYIVMHVLSQGGKFYFLSMPYVLGNSKSPDQVQWYDCFYPFAINLFYIVQEFRDLFDKRSIKKALSNNLKGILKGIMVHRAKGYTTGLGTSDPKLKILTKLYWNYSILWVMFPFLVLPRSADKILYRIYKWLFR